MTAADDPTPKFACPDLMAAMMVALDIDPNRLASPWNWALVQHATVRCDACAAKGECRRWLGGANDRPAALHDFCPNAGLFDWFRTPSALAD